jgi:hypothetical protein
VVEVLVFALDLPVLQAVELLICGHITYIFELFMVNTDWKGSKTIEYLPVVTYISIWNVRIEVLVTCYTSTKGHTSCIIA